MNKVNADLDACLHEFIEMEARSGSMDPALIAPEYFFRMWGGKFSMEEIEKTLMSLY